MPDIKTLYDEDFVAWLEAQATALRAAARSGSNQEIDWENLAEEIDGLARSERRELRSRLAVVIKHLIKLELSPARAPREDWENTVRRERMDIELVIEDSPSLAREVPDLAQKAVRLGSENAVQALELHGELSTTLREVLKSKSYTPEQILGDWFPPDPQP